MMDKCHNRSIVEPLTRAKPANATRREDKLSVNWSSEGLEDLSVQYRSLDSVPPTDPIVFGCWNQILSTTVTLTQ